MPASRPIGFWVKTVDRLIDARFAASAAEAGISRRQWQILNVLAEREGATRAEIATALAPFLNAGEVVDTHLAGLELLVTDDGDRLGITADGRARLADVGTKTVQQLRDLVSDGLAREDYETTVRTLERIARNLGWSDVD